MLGPAKRLVSRRGPTAPTGSELAVARPRRVLEVTRRRSRYALEVHSLSAVVAGRALAGSGLASRPCPRRGSGGEPSLAPLRPGGYTAKNAIEHAGEVGEISSQGEPRRGDPLHDPDRSVGRYHSFRAITQTVEIQVIQSQNAEVGYLYRRRLHVDEEKCPKRLLVNVVQPFRQEVSISRRINFQPPPN